MKKNIHTKFDTYEQWLWKVDKIASHKYGFTGTMFEPTYDLQELYHAGKTPREVVEILFKEAVE
jgi:hypothetical protein